MWALLIAIGLIVLDPAFHVHVEASADRSSGTKREMPHAASLSLTAALTQTGRGRELPPLTHALGGGGAGPRSEPCDGATWDNGAYDCVNTYTSERGPAGWVESWSADDVELPGGTIELAVWYASESYQEGTGTGEMVLVEDGGGFPADGTEFVVAGTLSRERIEDDICGSSIYLNSLVLDVSVSAGKRYVGLRPVFKDEGGRSFILTSPLSGTDSFIKSEFFGYPEWTRWRKLVGMNSNISFCLFMKESGEPSGACCDDGECEVLKPEDCAAKGGDYQGDGTSCAPNKCPGAPGACCLETGECAELTPDECDAAGGEFQGEGTRCRVDLCPIPDFCGGASGDVLYNNSVYNEVNALWNTWTEDGSGYIDGECADDVFNPYTSFDMQAIHYYQLATSGFVYTDHGSLSIYAADGPNGTPSTNLVDRHNLPEFRVDTGNLLFDYYPIWLHNLMGLSETLPAGTFWICGRPQTPAYNDYPTYLMSANVIGEQGYFRSPDFTGDVWVASESLFGSPQDFAFCIVGKITGEATGACCITSGDCFQETQEQCEQRGGAYQGDLTRCVPNTCPGAPGACCFDMLCEEIKEAQCAERGGVFLGTGVECTDRGYCPVLPFCIGSIYDQIDSDFVNGYSSEDATDHPIDSWTAENVPLTSRTQISGFAWMTIERPSVYPTGADFRILYAADGCHGPTTEIAFGDNVELTTRIYDGTTFNGYSIYYNGIDVPPLTLPPGDYYIGLRLQFEGHGRAYWLTAPLRECECYFQSQTYEYFDWTPWSDLFPYRSDVALCVRGEVGGPEVGACCVDDTCTLFTAEDCAANGGEFFGVDSRCYPNPCHPDPGACCLPGEKCESLLAAECAARNGEFKGELVPCRELLCLPPDPCVEAEHQNGAYDGFNGIRSQRGGNNEGEHYAVDDVTFAENAIITGAHWYTADDSDFQWTGAADLVLYLPDGDDGRPETLVAERLDIPGRRTANGDILFGRYVYLYSFSAAWPVAAGEYYLGLRHVVPSDSVAAAYWLTAPLSGRDGWLYSCGFGGCYWYSLWEYFGGPSNLSFCLDLGACAEVRGDANCSGRIDFDDIDCFVAALTGEEAWRACGATNGCDFTCVNDVNQDAAVDFADIDPFVECLIAGGCR